jgi:putative intracellular protease/amidase
VKTVAVLVEDMYQEMEVWYPAFRLREAGVKTVFVGTGKPVGAICHALWVCVSAKILRGRKATSFFAIKDDVVNAGATWVDEEVVVDRNLVTSRKPDDLPAFMREFLKLLGA